MGIYYNPPPQQLVAGRQPLDTRNFFVPPPTADSAPFSQGWLAGVMAGWDQDYSPVFVRNFIVPAAPQVDNPPRWNHAALDVILMAWRDPPPQPTQDIRCLLQPRIGNDPPLFDPAASINAATILASWRDPPPQPTQDIRVLLQPRIGNDPPGQQPSFNPALQLRWWKDPDPLPALRGQVAQAPTADNPPPLSTINLQAIVAQWRDPQPQPTQDIRCLIQPRTGDEPPRYSSATLISIIGQWAQISVPLQQRSFAPQDVVIAQVAFAQPWLVAVIQSWRDPAPAVLGRVLLNPALLDVPAVMPPHALDLRAILRGWEAIPRLPVQRAPGAATVPAPVVNDPPPRQLGAFAAIFRAWQPESPRQRFLPPAVVMAGAPSPSPGPYVPLGGGRGRIGTVGARDAKRGVGGTTAGARKRRIGSDKA